jgi:predicted DNA-binding transcriptional regulator AlpA
LSDIQTSTSSGTADAPLCDEYWDVKTIAAKIGVPSHWVRARVTSGRLKSARKVKGKWLVRADEARTLSKERDERRVPDDDEHFVSQRATADMLGVTPAAVVGHLKRGRLPNARKAGHHWRIQRTDVELHMASRAMPDGHIGTKEAAAILGVSRPRVHKLVADERKFPKRLQAGVPLDRQA